MMTTYFRKSRPRALTRPFYPGRSADSAVQEVAAIGGVRPDLGRPAALFDGLGPGLARQDLGALDLVEGAEARLAFDHDGLDLAPDRDLERLDLEAGDRDHPGDGQEARDVLTVVDSVKQRFLVGADVHRGGEHIGRVARHDGGSLALIDTVSATLGGGPGRVKRGTADRAEVAPATDTELLRPLESVDQRE